MLFLITYEILGLLDITLTPNYVYSRINGENLPLPIQIKLCKKSEFFSRIAFGLLEVTLNFQGFEKKASLIGQVFLNLLTPRDVLIYMHNRACF